MHTSGPALVVMLLATSVLAACDGSSTPHPSTSPPAPVAIAICASTVTVPSDTTQAVPSATVPPTAVIRAGGALSLSLPSGATVGLGAPVGRAAEAVLCRVSGAAGGVVLVGRQPGFVRVVVAVAGVVGGAAGAQQVVNVQVTV